MRNHGDDGGRVNLKYCLIRQPCCTRHRTKYGPSLVRVRDVVSNFRSVLIPCVVYRMRAVVQIIQELSLELSKHNRVAEHRDHLLNDSFRREKSDLFRRSAGAEARVAALEVRAITIAIESRILPRYPPPKAPHQRCRPITGMLSSFRTENVEADAPGCLAPSSAFK